MSEIVIESKKAESSKIVEEIVELRQLKSERNALKRTTDHYMHRVSELELKVSELMAQLMAKDYEIQVFHDKLQKLETSYRETSSDTIFEPSPIKDKKTVESNAHPYKACHLHEQKINELTVQVICLSEENSYLKAKLQNSDRLNMSTAHKTINSCDFKVSNIDLESNLSISPTNSTPRIENSIPEIQKSFVHVHFPEENEFVTPKKFVNPQPPQTRCKSEYPKRALNSSRQVKHVKCNLNEIMTSPSKSRNVADFCPSSLRRAKLSS